MAPHTAHPSLEPAVSFVVLAANHSRYIRDCVDSIVAQEGTLPFEIIVVDDGSTDGTAVILDGYIDSRLSVIRHAVLQGRAAALAAGLRRARAPLVTCIDGDDRYRPVFLRETVPFFAQFPTVAAVYGDAAMIDASGLMRYTRSQTYLPEGHRDFQKNIYVPLLEDYFISAAAMIARREAWLACLPVPQGLICQDWYFALQMARRAPFYYRDQVVGERRVGSSMDHAEVVHDRSEEASVFRLLNLLYRESEVTPSLERAKRRARGGVYAAHYLEMATKYFGQHMDHDARRCYLHAFYRRPWWVFKPAVGRRFIGTFIGRRAYGVLKRWWL